MIAVICRCVHSEHGVKRAAALAPTDIPFSGGRTTFSINLDLRVNFDSHKASRSSVQTLIAGDWIS